MILAPDEAALPEGHRRRRGKDRLYLAFPSPMPDRRIGALADQQVEADIGEQGEDRRLGNTPPLLALLLAPFRDADGDREQEPDPDIDDEQGVRMVPGARQGREQLDRIS